MEWGIDQLELSSQVLPPWDSLCHQIEHLKHLFEAVREKFSKLTNVKNDHNHPHHICNIYDFIFIAVH